MLHDLKSRVNTQHLYVCSGLLFNYFEVAGLLLAQRCCSLCRLNQREKKTGKGPLARLMLRYLIKPELKLLVSLCFFSFHMQQRLPCHIASPYLVQFYCTYVSMQIEMILNFYQGLKSLNHRGVSKEFSSRRKNSTTYK